MTTQAFEHELAPGQTLIADVSLMAVPFAWTAEVPDGTEIAYDGSISEAAGDWIEPAQNASISGDVSDYELDPFRYMRFRHTSGAGTATIRVAGIGRLEWSVA